MESIANTVYRWEDTEKRYISELVKTYSEDELININIWLRSKYGISFLEHYDEYKLKTNLVGNYLDRSFQERATPVELEFKQAIKKLAK